MRHVNAARWGHRRVATSAAAVAIGALTLLPSAAAAQVPADAAKAAKQVQGAAEKAAPGASAAAEAAAKASPELVGALSKELGASPAQAAGAAGSLFGVAKSRLKPEEFGQISKAVPGMDSLLKAAPSAAAAVGTAGALGQLGGSAAGLASAASAFSKLGLKPELVAKAIPVLTQFVGKTGGANVAGLLASVLK
jgi:Protein of unknown function VcgC/VcgE (DUF2780)